ncbi:MAG TPA: nucleoside hydrolase [Humisphaera sp.]|nr:nucleoside hydrolase [Humisphaera sp.]
MSNPYKLSRGFLESGGISRRSFFGSIALMAILISTNRASADAVKVVFDTDISSDVDDCGALAILNALADKGEAEILACVVNGHDADKASVAAVNAINMYYGRGNVPIGAYQGSHGNPSHSPYTAKLRDEFPHTAPADDKAPTALSVYRRALAAAPDGGVVIISVGFLMNLSDLVDSKADDVSPLAGLELVLKKVKRLVVMGGQFPNPKQFKEWNFSAGNVGTDAQHVVENWPTPILFSGFSIGQGISTGKALESTPAANPVRRAYQLYNNALKNGRSSWDPTAVLAGVRDPEKYWNVVSDGYCTVEKSGVNTWAPTPHRGHSYFAPKLSNAEMAGILDALMATPPVKKP